MTENKRSLHIFPQREQSAKTPVNREDQPNNLSKNDLQFFKKIRKVENNEDQPIERQKTQTLLILQKAQIQRLTESVDDYKCKLRNLNLENLDRKSYETQISQLFQNNNKNKFELQKLNTSIKNLVSSNEKYRKELSLANQKIFQLENNKRQFYQKYQVLKFQYDVQSEDFKVYKKETDENMQKAQKQILMHKGYRESLKANNQDLLKRVSTIPNYQSKIFQLETALSSYKSQNQLIKDEMARYKEKIVNMERNHSNLYENNAKVEKEHQKLKQLHEQLQAKVTCLQSQNFKCSQPLKSDRQATFSMKEAKQIAFLKEQVKEQNLRNQKTLTTCKALADISNKLKEQKRALEIEVQNLKTVLNDYQKKINDSLNKHSIFIHQSNKCHVELQKKLAESEKSRAILDKQTEKLSKQIVEYTKIISNKVSQCEQMKRKLIEVEDDLRERFQYTVKQQRKSFHNSIEMQKKVSEKQLGKNHNTSQQLAAANKENLISKQFEVQKKIQQIKAQNQQQQTLKPKQIKLQAQVPDQIYLQSSKYHNDIKKLTSQKDSLSKEVCELKGLLRQNDKKIAQSWKEISKLHDILEINQLKYKDNIEVYFRNNLGLEENLCKTQKSLANTQILYQESLKLISQLNEHNAQTKVIYSKLRSQFISILLLTGQLKHERNLLIKKNAALIKGVQHLNHEIKIIHEGAEKISMFFIKDSSIHQTLEKHYSTVQEIFNQIQKLKSGDEIANNLQTAINF